MQDISIEYYLILDISFKLDSDGMMRYESQKSIWIENQLIFYVTNEREELANILENFFSM